MITGAGPAFCAGQDLREHAELLEAARAGGLTLSGCTTTPSYGHQDHAQAGDRRGQRGRRRRRRVAWLSPATSASRPGRQPADGLRPGRAWPPTPAPRGRLQRLAGAGRAAELLMLAEPLAATRALELGLVNRWWTMRTCPRRPARWPPGWPGPDRRVRGHQGGTRYAAGHDLAASLEQEAEVQAALGRTADHRAATLAFVQQAAAHVPGQVSSAAARPGRSVPGGP